MVDCVCTPIARIGVRGRWSNEARFRRDSGRSVSIGVLIHHIYFSSAEFVTVADIDGFVPDIARGSGAAHGFDDRDRLRP